MSAGNQRAALITPMLQRKCWRELWGLRAQAFAIALVVMGGVAVCVMSLFTYASLQQTRDHYYAQARFADVFADLKRAPQRLQGQLQALAGVTQVETRVVGLARVELPAEQALMQALVTSIPNTDSARLNQLTIIKGRLPAPFSHHEIVIADAFAEARGLQPGADIVLVIQGRRQPFRVVGIGLAPDFIYQMAPGAVFPDYAHFGVMWLRQQPLERALGLEGAFNQVSLQVKAGIDTEAVIEAVDRLLARYGGQGAYDREQQFSFQFLREEFAMLRQMATIFPVVFLSVAIFLLHVVITRLIGSQREIIGILKAFGYSGRQVGWHYMQMMLVITGVGLVAGIALGVWLGQGLTAMYGEYYRFVELISVFPYAAVAGLTLLTLLATVFGTAQAIRQAMRLTPAAAMRPAPPPAYVLRGHKQPGREQRRPQRDWVSPATRMMIRHLQQQPLQTGLAILGLAAAGAIMLAGNFQMDSVRHLLQVQFEQAQRQDLEVVLHEALGAGVLASFRAIPGVREVEGWRAVPVRLQYRQRDFRTVLLGMPPQASLQRVLDTQLRPLDVSASGVMVTAHLANKLGFEVGAAVQLQALSGRQQTLAVTVAALSQEYLGVGVYLPRASVNRLMGEAAAVNRILLRIDAASLQAVLQRLQQMPAIASINQRGRVRASFEETLQEVLLTFTLVNALLGGLIAFGVVYNTVRIALAERLHALATLRVLGYHRSEVVYILVGELTLLVVASFPCGAVLGYGLCDFLSRQMATDLYRLPLVISTQTYTFSILVVCVASVLSVSFIGRRLFNLDLVAALKARE